jgi:hypothetical protein
MLLILNLMYTVFNILHVAMAQLVHFVFRKEASLCGKEISSISL